jgi:hypothetical protein
MLRRNRRVRVRSAALARTQRTRVVAPCRCAGVCRCSGLVPALLLHELERDCEFYRDVM